MGLTRTVYLKLDQTAGAHSFFRSFFFFFAFSFLSFLLSFCCCHMLLFTNITAMSRDDERFANMIEI